MEINRSDAEKPQQIVWTASEYGRKLGQVRCYRCTFCKRGFLNAQALGGHMNIHRKDRARLKWSSEETLISKKNASPASPDVDDMRPPESDHDHQKFGAHKRPLSFSDEDEEIPRRKDGFKEVLQLPSFTDKSSINNDLGTTKCGDGHGSSASLELDLELRLGP